MVLNVVTDCEFGPMIVSLEIKTTGHRTGELPSVVVCDPQVFQWTPSLEDNGDEPEIIEGKVPESSVDHDETPSPHEQKKAPVEVQKQQELLEYDDGIAYDKKKQSLITPAKGKKQPGDGREEQSSLHNQQKAGSNESQDPGKFISPTPKKLGNV